jgi:hypothetical protein
VSWRTIQGGRRNQPSKLQQPMKKTALVLMFSAVAIGRADADETILRDQRVAQMGQPTPPRSSSVSCMPIGLTARGELVFPWECREIIERERGPVSADISAAPNDTAPKDAAKGPAPTEPVAREQAAKAAAAEDAASGDRPAPRNTEPDQVGTIPDTAPVPPNAAATAGPSDRRSLQPKRAAVRRQPDSKRPGGPVPPSTSTTVRPNRVARVPPAQ